MKFFYILLALLCITTLSYAQESNHLISQKIQSPLLGTWVLTDITDSTDGPAQCKEYHNFRENSQLVVNSGQEWVTGHYYYDTTLNLLGTFIEYDNHKVDCYGNQIDDSGHDFIFKVTWKNDDLIELCDIETSECYFNLERLKP